MNKLSLYIHIPFCVKKCNYCNFISFCSNEAQKENYIKALIKEIKLRGKEFGKTREISSIYVGGGTPSVLKEGVVAKIMTEVRNSFKILPNCEISIEVNPNSFTEKKALEYKLVGFNRLSIGAQSLNDKILKVLGRSHNKNDIKNAINIAKKTGFQNINVDVMLALPNQKVKDVKKMIRFLVKKEIPHISPYSLILEENTPLFKQVNSKKVSLPTEEKSVEMYNTVFKYLTKHKYNRYEVSNFSIADYECKHNLNYWKMGEYLALGLAGHSFVNSTRFANTSIMSEYLDRLNKDEIPVISKERISPLQRKDETIMLALRTAEGINLREFDENFSCHLMKDKKKEINFLINHGFISVKDGYLKVKDNAFYVLNSIIEKLV